MEERESCVFHANWLKAAQTIQDPNKRCIFYECVIHYALTGEQLEAPADIQLALTVIYGLADIDRSKYKQKCERYKENAKKRYQQQQSQANDAMACNGMQSQAMATDTDTATDTVTDTGTGTDTDKPKGLKISPLTPQGENGAGQGFNFSEFYSIVEHTTVPKQIIDLEYENQYIWRVASNCEHYDTEISKAIVATQSKDTMRYTIQTINSRHKPNVPFEAVTLAMAMRKLKTRAQVQAFIDEANRSAAEQGIYRTLLDKAKYISEGKHISSLKSFLKARQT